jgi:hypothetical protein
MAGQRSSGSVVAVRRNLGTTFFVATMLLAGCTATDSTTGEGGGPDENPAHTDSRFPTHHDFTPGPIEERDEELDVPSGWSGGELARAQDALLQWADQILELHYTDDPLGALSRSNTGLPSNLRGTWRQRIGQVGEEGAKDQYLVAVTAFAEGTRLEGEPLLLGRTWALEATEDGMGNPALELELHLRVGYQMEEPNQGYLLKRHAVMLRFPKTENCTGLRGWAPGSGPCADQLSSTVSIFGDIDRCAWRLDGYLLPAAEPLARDDWEEAINHAGIDPADHADHHDHTEDEQERIRDIEWCEQQG